jgi:hypothetical protein
MRRGSISIIIGCFFVLGGISLFGSIGLLFVLPGLCAVMDGIFMNKGYYNKTYYMTCFGIFFLWGLLLVYISIFMPSIYLTDKNQFYFFIGIFALLIVGFSISYLRRGKNPKISWKNEW